MEFMLDRIKDKDKDKDKFIAKAETLQVRDRMQKEWKIAINRKRHWAEYTSGLFVLIYLYRGSEIWLYRQSRGTLNMHIGKMCVSEQRFISTPHTDPQGAAITSHLQPLYEEF